MYSKHEGSFSKDALRADFSSDHSRLEQKGAGPYCRMFLTLETLAAREPFLSVRVPIRMSDSQRQPRSVQACSSVRQRRFSSSCKRRERESVSHRLRSAAASEPQKHERSAGFCFPSPTSHSGPWATHASHGMNSLVALLDNLHDLAVFALEAGAVWVGFEESVPLLQN